MTYVVTDKCLRCRYTDCAVVCPVQCFKAGKSMLVIDPDECIDCGLCEYECPPKAILPDTLKEAEEFLPLNKKYAKLWPRITVKQPAPSDADDWVDKKDKMKYFTPEPDDTAE